MRTLRIYGVFFFLLLFACSKSKEKVLFPTKVKVGSTQYEFLYNPRKDNRIYCVTTTRPNFYEVAEYTYCDDHYREPDHPLKNYIYSVKYSPDKGSIGWDGTDYFISKSNRIARSQDNPERIVEEWEQKEVYLPETTEAVTFHERHAFTSNDVKHVYDAQNQVVASTYYSGQGVSKRVAYTYSQGKLSNASFYAAAAKPYLQIELAYDARPGYLKNLPLDTRFLPLELPYRDHNIVSYKVKDGQGKIRKELSYTCTYTYNRDGYPDSFTRNMLDGRKVKGYMVYRTETKDLDEFASAQ